MKPSCRPVSAFESSARGHARGTRPPSTVRPLPATGDNRPSAADVAPTCHVSPLRLRRASTASRVNRAAGSAGSPMRRCGCRARVTAKYSSLSSGGAAHDATFEPTWRASASQCSTAAMSRICGEFLALAAFVVREKHDVTRAHDQLLAEHDARRRLAVRRRRCDDHRVRIRLHLALPCVRKPRLYGRHRIVRKRGGQGS